MSKAAKDQFADSLEGSVLDADQRAVEFSARLDVSPTNFDVLRKLVASTLQGQGFTLDNAKISPPNQFDKDHLRKLHATAVRHRIATARKPLARFEGELLGRIANGKELNVLKVSPYLKEVQAGTKDELLFRYASLHWSIPVSSGYGRRLRFLVIDGQNDKLIGLFGLGDPVFSLRPRDEWINWNKEDRRIRLRHVMEAFVVGAVPPYSYLLCGKLIALLVASNEVRRAFARKYSAAEAVISKRSAAEGLVLVTTASALGKSSLYNRVYYRGRRIYYDVGFTQGSGEFHFANGLYDTLQKIAHQHCKPTAKHAEWGKGFRSRREVIKKALVYLGLPTDWLYHGVRREVFAVPFAENSAAFLKGVDHELKWYDSPAADLVDFFRDRWLIPRSQRDERFRAWQRDEWKLWR